ncbi:MAG: Ribonuclease HII [Candidatus Alkanophagales archaeon MCA70_species_1]|nr:Ribonuclease HII [Candidatus Alkanophaga volatiphilum]
MRVVGVDEAGRGPVIGSMFVAGVVYTAALERLGIKDSKKLSAKRRETLAREIEKLTEVYVVEVSPTEIDELRRRMTMNDIAVLYFSAVLRHLRPDVAFVDAADVNPKRFAERLRERLNPRVTIIAEHGADEKYVVVGAASIIAKVRRDASIRELEKKIGERIGSGYPADPLTREFLKKVVLKEFLEKKKLPSYVRASWRTVKELLRSEGDTNGGTGEGYI